MKNDNMPDNQQEPNDQRPNLPPDNSQENTNPNQDQQEPKKTADAAGQGNEKSGERKPGDDPGMDFSSAAGSDDPGDPPPSLPPAEINYEDLGIQLGINEDRESKDDYKRQLREKIAEIEQKYNALCLEFKGGMNQFRSDLGSLVNEDLLEHIAGIDEQKNNSLKRLLTHEMALRQILKHVNDEERKNKILDSALFEIDSIVGEARVALQAFKQKLNEKMNPGLMDERFKDHLIRQNKLFRHLMHVYKQEEDLERGYNYGKSVRTLLGSRL